MSVKQLPLSERPRERLLYHGAGELATTELLTIVLRTGTQQRSVLDLANFLLARFGGLRGILYASVEELKEVPGIGTAKAVELKAALELGSRLRNSAMETRPMIKTPRDVVDLVMEDMRFLDREQFRTVLLDTRHRVITVGLVSVGHLNGSLVHPRELFKESIRRSSAAVILVHNHPSGDPDPSDQDVAVTKRIVEAGKLLGIDVLDHVVVGDNRYASLKELNLM